VKSMPQIHSLMTTEMSSQWGRRLTWLSTVRPQTKQQVHDRLISHCAYVAQLVVANCNLAQNTSHDLPGSCLWQTGSFLHEVRLSKRTNLLSYCMPMQQKTATKVVLCKCYVSSPHYTKAIQNISVAHKLDNHQQTILTALIDRVKV